MGERRGIKRLRKYLYRDPAVGYVGFQLEYFYNSIRTQECKSNGTEMNSDTYGGMEVNGQLQKRIISSSYSILCYQQ